MTTPTSTTAPKAERRYVGDLVGQAAGEIITELQRKYSRDVPLAVARLAQLRRGAGKLPADVPELWGLTGAERLYVHQELSESESSRAEAALFVTLTLYALHQQSRPGVDMHKLKSPFGGAVRQLMGEETDTPIRKRFVQIGTSSTFPMLAERLRGMVKLLRAESIPLDYVQLGRQLYQAQSPAGLAQVRDAWGRSFHAYRPLTTAADTNASAPSNSGEATNDKDTP